MLSFFKKLFGQSTPAAAPPLRAVAVPSAPMPTVEVTHLSLAAITARFAEELQPLLAQTPEAAATVALPLPTILKQLPAGIVRMSLASLQRQAHGVIQPLAPGDKRLVEIPLAEIFRHLRPGALKRRLDQRPVFVPENGYNLFGDSTNPYSVSPDDYLEETQVLDLTPVATAHEVVESGPRVLKMDDGLREHFSHAPTAKTPLPASAIVKMEQPVPAPAAPVAWPEGPTLAMKLAPLAAQWPEDIRAEIAALDPETTVTLPANDVSAGLAKGRVAFSWAQIHAWLEPAPAPSSAALNTVLPIPLKIVAPAFLSASKQPATERKSVQVDASIPALFSGGQEPEPVPEPHPISPPAEHAPPHEAPAHADPHKLPETVAEIFGVPHKEDWTPAEIVAGAVKLPGVSGAIVALQEGLQVAASLPDGVKSEVVAAFLPQIFARLNQYSSEMRLGEVDDLLFTTHGAHCQIYRLGYVYLAILGQPGEALPWHELRLISEELARQTNK